MRDVELYATLTLDDVALFISRQSSTEEILYFVTRLDELVDDLNFTRELCEHLKNVILEEE